MLFRSLLAEYREVRRPGNTLSEELSRRERRFVLEPRILDTMGLIGQSMSGGRGSGAGPAAARELTYEPLEDGRVAGELG